ncbi:MAG: DNA-directed RNA polymerase subunit beta [Enterobacteriaceae bacterium PSpicST2]|nr:MAG: DNA-directed RNA polymerase subunit beta [Enterobacteriaceae bacterium PSpicST2]
MNYFNNVKKNIRKSFSKHLKFFEVPYLLSYQIETFKKFINKDLSNKMGIENVLRNFFPIYNYNFNISLKYIDYKITKPLFNYQECKNRGITYCGMLKVKLKLTIYFRKFKKIIKFIKEKIVNICEIPLMTKNATFVVNGVERVIVSQLHRSPGIIFDSDKGKTHFSKKILYNAKVIPYSGTWLDFEFDLKDILYARIDRHKKIPVTTILRALNYTTGNILNMFYKKTIFDISGDKIKMYLIPNRLKGEVASFDIISKNKIYIKKGSKIKIKNINELKKDKIKSIFVPYNFVYSKTVVKDYHDKYGNLICMANMTLSKNIINELKINGYNKIETIYTNNTDNGNYISNTLHFDPTYDRLSALIEIYHILKSDEITTLDVAEKFFDSLFFTGKKYNLSKVGRIKLNYSISRMDNTKSIYLDKIDIILIIKKLLNIRNGKDKIDDVDSLGNRRIRSVGEMINSHFYLSLMNSRNSIKEKLSIHKKFIFPKNFINSKIISIYFKNFFISNPLSQFMNQNNLLSEITHKRRISALGPCGLTLERAGFEVRDIHSSHYGRICPIETPEGPNIGLINSFSIYSQINKYGFLETPYRLVRNGKITKKICYLSFVEEENYIIAQANSKINKRGEFIEKLISCRYKNESGFFNAKEINYIDVSNQQILSIGASLIPFLEHNDANRSLMGANMQRQAVPLLFPDKPIVGTGMEHIIAVDSGMLVLAKRNGIVKYVDATKIIIKVDNNMILYNKENLDTYNLIKYTRSNQNTCINQTPCISLGEKILKGDVLADCSSTDHGELSLGQNMRVAFMSWNGYNFEDSILISEKIVQQNKFTTIHIHELLCEIKDTKVGSEKIIPYIPGLPKNMFSKLNKSGIIKIGTEVFEGDILISKITPKSKKKLKSEEKLLFTIFGDKSPEIQDSSLRVPHGISGKVIDIKIFKKKKKYKKKFKKKKKKKKKKIKKLYIIKNVINEFKILFYNCIYELLKYNNINFLIIKKIKFKKIFKFIFKNKIEEKKIINLNIIYNNFKNQSGKKNNIVKKKKHNLGPGILKIIKIYIMTKHNIQPGDKISGRHGNKGVVSKINLTEDMPYDKYGVPIDIILNPLGVPSRMNVGQILEVHLGMAAKQLGKKINKMIKKQKKIYKIRKFIQKIYNFGINNVQKINFNKFTDNEILLLAKNLRRGVPVSSPVFDGANEIEIKKFLKLSGVSTSGQITLFDGQTGEKFERPITVGYMYILKLNHLVVDKIHARSIGSYSLITQQPLKGKAKFGGQRVGEMEVWALEAYGAAYILQEMLTIKSDDINGRIKIYKKIVNNKYYSEPNIPESFNVLVKEIKSLGINIELYENK